MRTLCCRVLAALALLVPGGAAGLEWQSPYGRVSADGWVEGQAVFRTDPDSPGQRPQALWVSKLGATPMSKLRLYLETRTQLGGPPEHADGFGAFNFRDTFQNLSPSVEFSEAWADVDLGALNVRAGVQRYTWARLDRFSPSDVVNTRRYTDPFLTDEQDAKLGIPSIRMNWYLPAARWVPRETLLSLVWVPIPFPVRFPLEDERWFPPAINTIGELDIQRGALGNGLPPANTVVDESLITQNRRPSRQLDEGSVGLRLTGTVKTVDWGFSFYDGAETATDFSLEARAQCSDPTLVNGVCDASQLDATGILRPRFDRMRTIGADAAFQIAGVTGRFEAVYGMDRHFPRPASDLLTYSALRNSLGTGTDLANLLVQLAGGRQVPITLEDLYLTRDAVQWGLGVDTIWRGFQPILQVNQLFVLDNDVRLLVPDVDTRITFVVRKGFLDDTLTTEVSVVQGLERSYTSAIFKIAYAITDNLRIRAGYLAIAGSRNSVIGQYHDNDQGFLQLRYSY